MGSLVCPCCCCCYSRAAVRRLHWAAFSSQKECVWQLNQSVSQKWRSGLNRRSHPDWVKLSVELNLRAKPKYEISLHYKVYCFFKWTSNRLPLSPLRWISFCFDSNFLLLSLQRLSLHLLTQPTAFFVSKSSIIPPPDLRLNSLFDGDGILIPQIACNMLIVSTSNNKNTVRKRGPAKY